MSLFTSMLYLLDNAEADGISVEPDVCQFVVDRKLFWHEMEREMLHFSEPMCAFGRHVYLCSDINQVELRCLDDRPDAKLRYVPATDWQLEADGDEILRQSTWRVFKSLPEDMKDPRWADLINAAETMEQMTELHLRIEALRRSSLRRAAPQAVLQ